MKTFITYKSMYFLTAIIIFAVAIGVSAQETKDTHGSHDKAQTVKSDKHPASETGHDNHADHPGHDAVLRKNGEKEMGFSQTETTHHFLLMKGGGAIQVEANELADALNRNKIRIHLKEIAEQFTAGIFATPFAIHGVVPPGASVMNRLKRDIKYRYEETKKGARVRILTRNPEALKAIRDFLRFQITEHKTGDRMSLKS